MYLPIINTIFNGALSPTTLEKLCATDERLRQDTRRLGNLPTTASEASALLAQVLGEWGVEMPLFSSSYSSDSSPSPNLRMFILALREDELDYSLRLCGYMEKITPRYSFYQALLQVECRWLKLHLWENIASLHSDSAARLLLIEVLEEIYCTYVLIVEHSIFHIQVAMCKQLSVALATLYLDIAITFSSFLQKTDYIVYQQLLNDTSVHQPLSDSQLLECNILKEEGCVRQLFSFYRAGFIEEVSSTAPHTPLDSKNKNIEEAEKLYLKLVQMHSGLVQITKPLTRLQRGITMLENYLFLLYKGPLPAHVDLLLLLSNPQWITQQIKQISNEEYSAHHCYSDARGAISLLESQLQHPCLDFVRSSINPQGSLPQRLRELLQRCINLYELNYSGTFLSRSRGEEQAVVALRSDVSKQIDKEEIRQKLAFLAQNMPHSSTPWMSAADIQKLHIAFYHFLCTNSIVNKKESDKVVLPLNKAGVIYGLFFDDCDTRNGHRGSYAEFLVATLNTSSTALNLLTNFKRYINNFREFCTASHSQPQ